MTLSSRLPAGCPTGFRLRSRRCGRTCGPRGYRGFTLIEVLVITVIISFLAMVAVPSLTKIRTRAKTASVVNDFRVFSAAFNSYAQESGDFPAESAAGVVPTGMTAHLKGDAWKRVTPMGGKYDWESNQTHFGTKYRAAIAINAATGAPLTLDVPQLTDIDRFMDDGNLLGGSFRIGNSLCPLFVIQP
ncbi:MAG: type II secretion system protein [Verrucomicrobia bacterium]|nr:type II secretion system protein [Verrucomicrobiota bacterium]